MSWTSEKPTAEGWYWRKFLYCHVEHVEVCRVQKFGEIGGELGVWERGAVKDLTGLWLGPIAPDSYQQGRVAGLREAEKYALRCLKELQDKIRDLESGKCVLAGAQTKEGVEVWVHAKTLEASRIAKWITARIIEQQAQEGGVGDANIKMS